LTLGNVRVKGPLVYETEFPTPAEGLRAYQLPRAQRCYPRRSFEQSTIVAAMAEALFTTERLNGRIEAVLSPFELTKPERLD
jgi:hypothetical protein